MQNTTDTQEQRKRLHRRGICVIIPTYNNGGTIADVITRVKELCDDVIVVNDGCTDNTAEILRNIDGITIVINKKNSGKGAALRAGFKKAIALGFAYAITLDADGQHYPEDIPLLLAANIEHPRSIIIGERKDLNSKERSGGSRFANAFSNFWFCVQTGRRLKDTQTGYRLYPLKHLFGLQMLTSRYEAELELLVFASWHGVKIFSQPINVYYPPREKRVSHFRPVYDFTRITILNTLLCFLAVCYALPVAIIRLLLIAGRTIYSLLFFLLTCILLLMPFNLYCMLCVHDKNKITRKIHFVLYHVGKLVWLQHGIPGVRNRLVNPHNEDFSRPAVVICNHQSPLDLMAMLALSPRLAILTKDWVYNNKLFGAPLRKGEYYPASLGIEELMPRIKSLVERGYSIAIYPEGTRSPDCSIQLFHQGAFYIARELQLDIIPVVEYAPGKVLPKGGKYLHKGVFQVEIDRRFTYEEYSKFGFDRRVTRWFRNYYKERYAEMSDKLDQL